ncbi:tetratricopeptide repeat protein [Pseudanabaena sp. BC1403]|uniref:tetratricopeptide repeat protein n=1 Tax=Pseudanabaena sp. BC1403 TaxID=2043171 RepID=UPI000CD833B9|nr:tetratricopeptide repeat protein [Pseudanabaena sp. BC1403]
MMLLNKNMIAHLGMIGLGAGILWGIAPSPVQANDRSVLCSNRQMTTQVALTTPEYFAAICSRGYLDQSTGCYVPTEYYYVGQSRSTKETLTVPRGIIEVSQQPPITIYKATERINTYQIATSGPQTREPWTSLSIFENGRRIYHHKVNDYLGDRQCRPQYQPVPIPSSSFTLPFPKFEPIPEPKLVPFPKIPPSLTLPLPNLYLPQRSDKTIEGYSRQIAANPNNLKAYFARGNRYYDLKRYQEAIADYKQVIRLKPNHAISHFNQGVSYYRANNPKEALVSFEAAIAHALVSDPQSPLLAMFYNNLGIVQRDQLPIAQASSVFLEAIKINPNYALSYYNRGLLIQSFRGNELAIADYTKAIKLSPLFVMAYLNRGRAYYDYDSTASDYAVNTVNALTGAAIDNTKNYQQAIADYTAATNIDPTNALAYFQRGIVHYRMKNYDQAIADFTQAITLDNNYLDAYTNLGIVYAEGKKDYGRAIFYFGRTKEKNPQYAPSYYNLAVGYAALTPKDSGLIDAYYKKAIALDRQYESDYHKDLSQQHYAFQDDYELIPALAEIIVPSDPLTSRKKT